MRSKHKYLEELGVKYPFDIKMNPIRRFKTYLNYRKYGTNPVHAYDLRTYYFIWMYENISQYLNDADKVVDLEYYKFTFRGKEYSQKELIKLLLNTLADIIKVNDQDYPSEYCKSYVSEVNKISKYGIYSSQSCGGKLVMDAKALLVMRKVRELTSTE